MNGKDSGAFLAFDCTLLSCAYPYSRAGGCDLRTKLIRVNGGSLMFVDLDQFLEALDAELGDSLSGAESQRDGAHGRSGQRLA
jgi:hypothetical protein